MKETEAKIKRNIKQLETKLQREKAKLEQFSSKKHGIASNKKIVRLDSSTLTKADFYTKSKFIADWKPILKQMKEDERGIDVVFSACGEMTLYDGRSYIVEGCHAIEYGMSYENDEEKSQDEVEEEIRSTGFSDKVKQMITDLGYTIGKEKVEFWFGSEGVSNRLILQAPKGKISRFDVLWTTEGKMSTTEAHDLDDLMKYIKKK